MMDVARVAQAAAGRLTVRSALNPLLWLCGIVAVPAVVAATKVTNDRPLMWALLIIAGLVIGTTCGIAILFAWKSPEKLQSEDFQLRQQSLNLLQGKTGTHVIDAVTIIANPAAAASVEGMTE